MSRTVAGRFVAVGVFSAVLLLGLVAGCVRMPGETEFYTMEASEQQLRDIETLKLQERPEDEDQVEPNIADVNEAQAGVLELTLAEARVLAMKNNLSLKATLIDPAIARQRVGEEEAKFEWSMFGNAVYGKTDQPTSTLLTGTSVDSWNGDVGVSMPLRTGGTLTFDLADRRVKTNNIFSTLNPAYSSGAALSISHQLLRGAGVRANTHSIRVASYQRQITDARTKLEVIRVLATADRVYWRLYAARRQLEVRKQQLDLAQLQLEQARRFVRSGQRSPVEVLRAEAGVAQQLESIIVAENAVRDRERELKRIVNKPGLGLHGATVVKTMTLPEPVVYELDRERLVTDAIENRMEMLELELQLAEDISRIDYLRNQALPLATMDYAYNVNGLGATQSDSYDLLFDKRFEDHRLGLQMVIPLGNEQAKRRVQAAFLQRRQRLATRESRADLIELEVLNAVDQIEANWQRILAARQSSILDGRLYEAEKRQFELGLRTTTDVLEAQTNYANAQSAEIAALTEYQIALVDLAYATGTLLGKAKVHWNPITPEGGIE